MGLLYIYFLPPYVKATLKKLLHIFLQARRSALVVDKRECSGESYCAAGLCVRRCWCLFVDNMVMAIYMLGYICKQGDVSVGKV